MKLTKFTNPVSGEKGDLTNFNTLWSNTLGVLMLFVVFSLGQKGADWVAGKTPLVDPVNFGRAPVSTQAPKAFYANYGV